MMTLSRNQGFVFTAMAGDYWLWVATLEVIGVQAQELRSLQTQETRVREI